MRFSSLLLPKRMWEGRFKHTMSHIIIVYWFYCFWKLLLPFFKTINLNGNEELLIGCMPLWFYQETRRLFLQRFSWPTSECHLLSSPQFFINHKKVFGIFQIKLRSNWYSQPALSLSQQLELPTDLPWVMIKNI